MKFNHSLALFAFALCLSSPLWAEDKESHAGHSTKNEPELDKAFLLSTKAHEGHEEASQSDSVQDVSFDRHIKAMKDMHDKMITAKSSVEKKQLMNDQISVLQEASTALRQSESGHKMKEGMKKEMEEHHKKMEKRLQMIELMLQQLIDRTAQ